MAENTRFGREPVQVVKIDQDFCSRTYGELPCSASLSENLLLWTGDFSNSYWDKSDCAIVGSETIGGETYTIFDINDAFDSGFISSPNSGAPIGSTEIGIKYTMRASMAKRPSDDYEMTFQFVLSLSDGITDENAVIGVIVGASTGTVKTELISADAAFNAAYSITVTDDTIDFEASSNIYHPAGTIDSGLFQATAGGGNPLNLADDTFSIGKVSVFSGSLEQEFVATFDEARQRTGTQKCFNTRATCQDPANYDKTVLPLRFVNKQTETPKDGFYIPSVTSVKVTPAKLNPGGANANARALGQRASISVSFMDHPSNDRLVDPYRSERSYNPEDRGTFWTKWRARNPYYMQRPIQLITGYLKDGAIVDQVSRDFVITGFSGPDSNGNVTISGKDVLTLAEDEKAQAPVASRGKLSAAITSTATSATLTPAGIGNDEYPASGQVRIGKEVMSFTRSGDNLTLTRGQFGTAAVTHDEDDTVQLCLRYQSQAPQDILYDLLLNYANIPAAYLDKVQWDAEALDFLPRLYSAIITEPNGVSKLISEMCQQMYFTIWWDERQGKVILKSVRLAQEDEVFELDDNQHLIADSISWQDLADELITQVWVYYGQLDPTEKLDQGSNYATIAITADPSAEGPDKHNLRRIKTIFSRWIDATNASAAEDLGQRILNRYGNAPRQVTFRVDAKDGYLWLGDYIRLTNRMRVDSFGLPVPVNLQIFEAEEASLGSEFRFVAQEFIPALISDTIDNPNERVIPITSDLLNVNLRTLHDSLFGAPAGTETITFVVREGVTIGGDAAGGGVNVAAGARVATNDFYASGTSQVIQSLFSVAQSIGVVPALQRSGISTPRSFSPGATYSTIGALDVALNEYPVSAALDTGTWPAGVTVSLIVEPGARILGEGGAGAAHVVTANSAYTEGSEIRYRHYNAIPGGDGGDAMVIRNQITVTNGGTISAGGGGGCASAVFANTRDVSNNGTSYMLSPGGGGAGLHYGQTTSLVTYQDTPATVSIVQQRQPVAGSQTVGGAGGAIALSGQSVIEIPIAGDLISNWNGRALGGSGGNLNASGVRALLSASAPISVSSTKGIASVPGKAIRSGANLVSWVNKGDVRGQEVI